MGSEFGSKWSAFDSIGSAFVSTVSVFASLGSAFVSIISTVSLKSTLFSFSSFSTAPAWFIVSSEYLERKKLYMFLYSLYFLL
jgi:hypothetical protein